MSIQKVKINHDTSIEIIISQLVFHIINNSFCSCRTYNKLDSWHFLSHTPIISSHSFSLELPEKVEGNNPRETQNKTRTRTILDIEKSYPVTTKDFHCKTRRYLYILAVKYHVDVTSPIYILKELSEIYYDCHLFSHDKMAQHRAKAKKILEAYMYIFFSILID